jgi:hypothetical protein
VGHKIIHLDFKDIYFQIGLSSCSEILVLKGGGNGCATRVVDEYIVDHYQLGSRKSNDQLQIKYV